MFCVLRQLNMDMNIYYFLVDSRTTIENEGENTEN